jgi:hypothetical protein
VFRKRIDTGDNGGVAWRPVIAKELTLHPSSIRSFASAVVLALSSLAVLGLGSVPRPAAGRTQPEPRTTGVSSSDGITVAVALAALRVNDEAIRSLRANQRFLLHLPDGSTRERAEGVSRFDGFGGWAFEGQFSYWSDGGQPPARVQYEERFRDARFRVWTWAPLYGQGLCRRADGEEAVYASIENNLGRTLTPHRAESLASLLQSAQELHVSSVVRDDDATFVTLSGFCELWYEVAWVDATIDLSRGGVVREIALRDAMLNYVFLRIRNTEFQSLDGVWIPTAGWREGFYRPTDEVHGVGVALQERFKVAGLPERLDVRDSRQRQLAAAIVQELFPDGVPGVERLGLKASFTSDSPTLNQGMDLRRAAIAYEPPCMVLNVHTGETIQMSSDADAAALRREQLEASPIVGPRSAGRPIDLGSAYAAPAGAGGGRP